MNRWLRLFGVLLLLGLVSTGCSTDHPTIQRTPDEEPLAQLGLAYRDASRALRRGPKNLNELQPYLKKYGDPKQLLVSPNDGQPYQINWGLMPMRPSKDARAHSIVAYEQTGKDGKRCVLDFMLKVRRVTDQEFERLQGSS